MTSKTENCDGFLSRPALSRPLARSSRSSPQANPFRHFPGSSNPRSDGRRESRPREEGNAVWIAAGALADMGTRRDCPAGTNLRIPEFSVHHRHRIIRDGAHVLGALEGARVAGQFFWLRLPLSCATDSYSCSSIQATRSRSIDADLPDAVPDERGAEHRHVGAGHEHLQHVRGAVDAAGGGEAGAARWP